jgi:DUF4097 and DUF4098 domain-containing protein YvlB
MPDNQDVYEFAASGPVDASVRIGAGDLIVVAEPTQTVVVEVSPYDDSDASRSAAANTVVDFNRGRLRVEAPDGGTSWIFRRSARVRIEIRLPQDSRLRAHSGSADIRIDGRISAGELTTGSGDAHVGTASGDLMIRTGSGDVRTDHVGGELKVSTGSGDVYVNAVAGAVSATTGSGDVAIDDAQGTVSAQTASGDVRLHTVRSGEVRVVTASGDVSVGVPAGTRVWLDLNTVSGSTSSNLEMSSTPPAGGAQVNLRLQTVSGDIAVTRVSAPPTPPPPPPAPAAPPGVAEPPVPSAEPSTED